MSCTGAGLIYNLNWDVARNPVGLFYTEGVVASSPGLAMRSEASYPGSRSLKKVPYPEGVIADRKRVCNNAFSVEEAGGLNPG